MRHLRVLVVDDSAYNRRTITELDEEPLIILEPIRCADDGESESIGMVVFTDLAQPLLVVGGSDDLGVRASRQPVALGLTIGRLYDDARHEVLNETNRDEVTRDLLDWVTAKVYPSRR